MKKVLLSVIITILFLNGCGLVSIQSTDIKKPMLDEEIQEKKDICRPNFWNYTQLTEEEVKDFEERYNKEFESCIKKDVFGNKEVDVDKTWELRNKLLSEASDIHVQRWKEKDDKFFNSKNNSNSVYDNYYEAEMAKRNFKSGLLN